VSSHEAESPLRAGSALALLSAALFGVSIPFVRRFSTGVGPFAAAALLYAGAALAALASQSARAGAWAADAPLRRASLGRVVAVAVCGAVIAPACLAWGLPRTNATLGSLLLASEAMLTVILARVFYREPIGARVAGALVAIGLGAAILVSRDAGVSATGALAPLAVLAAALGWAADNTLTRPLADVDPRHVVLAKGALGAALSLGVAFVAGETVPSAHAAAGLLATGALGYGVSVRVYLQAQRRIGAGRTGSIFAVAPFLGAVTAWLMGDGVGDVRTVVAAALVAVGVYLHVTEQHGHEHAHGEMEHEHAHRHDDGHHDHVHDPPFEGEHSHVHRHAAVKHVHPHGPDLHRQHSR